MSGQVKQIAESRCVLREAAPTSELHEGEHAAVIAPERYERVRALLNTSSRGKKRKGRNPAYLLTGLLRCKLCGSALTPASTRKGKREYRYYRCVTRDKHGSKACAARPLPAGEIERYVSADAKPPRLDKMGGTTFETKKNKVKAEAGA